MKVLVIAPHPDDEVIGCGGIMAKRKDNGNEVYVCIVTEGKKPMYSKEFIQNERREMREAHRRLGVTKTICLKYPSAKLDSIEMHKLNDDLADIVNEIKPDELYIPHIGDMHKDHQIVAESSMVAARPLKHKISRILAYEVLSETDWHMPEKTFAPNVYEEIGDFIGHKLNAFAAYSSQVQQYPSTRSAKALMALAGHRGAIIGVEYAEAFSLIREVVR